jgi:hypothetical protein
MTATDPKTDRRNYLQDAREALLWKLDGLSEYDIRRPLLRTGTNLLGLVKHQAAAELGYFRRHRYRRAWAHADATITDLPLDAVGLAPWWDPDRNDVTLHQILIHVPPIPAGAPATPTSSGNS